MLSDVWFQVTQLDVVSGHGSHVTTADGTDYLDFTSGIAVASTGHCHPKVVAAITDQAARFVHAQVNVYRHNLLAPLARPARDDHPGGDRHVLLHQLGRRGDRGRGEAGEAGHRASQRGRLRGQLPRPDPPDDGDDDLQDRLPVRVHAASRRDPRRPPFPASGAPTGQCLSRLRKLFETVTAPGETAAVVIEPVLGEGGYLPAPPAFLEGVAELCGELGVLFVADEVQTGFGRTGTCSRSSSTASGPTSW